MHCLIFAWVYRLYAAFAKLLFINFIFLYRVKKLLNFCRNPFIWHVCKYFFAFLIFFFFLLLRSYVSTLMLSECYLCTWQTWGIWKSCHCGKRIQFFHVDDRILTSCSLFWVIYYFIPTRGQFDCLATQA